MGKPMDMSRINIHEIPYDVLVGGLEHDWIMTFQKQLGIAEAQLTNSIIFQRGRLKPPSRMSLKMGNTLTSLNLAS